MITRLYELQIAAMLRCQTDLVTHAMTVNMGDYLVVWDTSPDFNGQQIVSARAALRVRGLGLRVDSYGLRVVDANELNDMVE